MGTPFAAGILELPHDLLLLGIDGDRRLALAQGRLDAGGDVFELGVAIGVPRAPDRLAIGLQAVAAPSEQHGDHPVARAMARAGQFGGQMPDALAGPSQR
jgi:hypothetical protein